MAGRHTAYGTRKILGALRLQGMPVHLLGHGVSRNILNMISSTKLGRTCTSLCLLDQAAHPRRSNA